MSETNKVRFNSALGAGFLIFLVTTIFSSGVSVQKLDSLLEKANKNSSALEKLDERLRVIEKLVR